MAVHHDACQHPLQSATQCCHSEALAVRTGQRGRLWGDHRLHTAPCMKTQVRCENFLLLVLKGQCCPQWRRCAAVLHACNSMCDLVNIVVHV